METDADLISNAVASLTDIQRQSYVQALEDGYKDEVCTKCKTVMLAHHHFVRCPQAAHGSCPMVANPKSLLEQLMDDDAVKSVTVRTPGRLIGG
ncbi:hypothetical protein LCGC14_0799400 [marine sediment metagenome]|uniref:Uncharacterized protein n=1 Tax=marine sediment metagenome TaxID=412755 RepID=A0A0F9PQ28_9ZZZZ